MVEYHLYPKGYLIPLGIRNFSALSVETTQTYLHADLRIKQQAMEKTRPVGVEPGRFRQTDNLLAFLEVQ